MTKTEKLRKALIAEGFNPVETRSNRECFHKLCTSKEGKTFDKYVWLLQATLRGASTNTFTASIALPKMTARLLAD